MNLNAAIELMGYGTTQGVLREWDERGRKDGKSMEPFGPPDHWSRVTAGERVRYTPEYAKKFNTPPRTGTVVKVNQRNGMTPAVIVNWDAEPERDRFGGQGPILADNLVRIGVSK